MADNETCTSTDSGEKSADTERDDTASSSRHGFERPATSLRHIDDLPLVDGRNYELGAEFARGGIGIIRRAYDRRLRREVAIKELKRLSTYTEIRFTREVRITARLQHPSIVPVHEAGRWPSGAPFFAMKLVEGGSLEEATKRCGSREERLRLVRHVADVADAIAYAHSQDIVHRDLKPSNVLVGPFGETVVIDWGLAKDLADPSAADLPPPDEPISARGAYVTTDGVVLGTPPYMPPEQALGKTVDTKSDVYAIGALLYHVLSGDIPYREHKPKDILQQVRAGPPTPLRVLEPDLPPDLLALVDKAMARDPADRYPSAREMAEEIQRFVTGGLVAAYHYSLGELLKRFVRRHAAAVVTGALATFMLAGFGAWSFVNIAEQKNKAESAAKSATQSALAEADARREAELQLENAILAAARAAVSQDPTMSVALLKRLRRPIRGAATVAADAEEHGVATRVIAAHDDWIETVAFSPDGRHVASSGLDDVVYLHDVATGKARALSKHDGRVPALAFSPNGSQLATAGYDGRVVLWDLATGQNRTFDHDAPMRALAFSADGHHLAALGGEHVEIHALAGGAAGERRWKARADRSAFLELTPDGTRLLSGSHGGGMKLWSLTDALDQSLEGHVGEVKTARVSADGKLVASGGEDGTIRIWSLTDGTAGGDGKATVLDAHPGGVEALAFSPDGTRLVSGGLDGDVRLWELKSKRSRVVATRTARVVDVAFSPDGALVAAASWDKTLVVIDLRTADVRQLIGHRDVVSSLAFAPDGRTIASGSWDHDVRLWPTEAAEASSRTRAVTPHMANEMRRRVLSGHRVGAKTVAFSPDGAQIASGGHDNVVRLWDARSGAELKTWNGHRDHVFRVIFSPDGRWVASSSDDATVRLWPTSGEKARVLEGHAADVEELAFSSNGRKLASAAEDDAVGLWDVANGDGRLLVGHDADVVAVTFSPDGKHLASAANDGSIRLWGAEDGSVGAVLTGHRGRATIAFAGPGAELVSAGADGTLRRWDIATSSGRVVHAGLDGASLIAVSADHKMAAVAGARALAWLCPLGDGACRTLEGHTTRIEALAFTPDGLCLVTGSRDGSVRLWSVESGESRPLTGHGGPVFDVAVSPDGNWVASASGDTSIRLWPVALPPKGDELSEWLDALTDLRVPDNAAP